MIGCMTVHLRNKMNLNSPPTEEWTLHYEVLRFADEIPEHIKAMLFEYAAMWVDDRIGWIPSQAAIDSFKD